jgi:peptidoglycan/LPS O-acetylase OafA/YrhL
MTSSLETADGPDGSTARPASGPRVGRLPSLTGMRFICAAMVFGLHSSLMLFFANQGVSQKYTAAVTEGGFTGVVYFFILSGFVLTWSARSGDRVGAFWRRRFFKIYPNYLVALILGIVLAVFVQGQVFNRKTGLLDLLLLQSWSNDLNARTSFNLPHWSLSCEALMYLCFPLLLKLVDKVRPERLWAGASILIAAIFAIPVISHLLPYKQQYPSGTHDTDVWLVLHFPATRLLDFVLGIFIARIVMTGRRLPLGLGGAVALTAAAYWLSAYVPERFGMVSLMVIPLSLVIAAAATQDSTGRPSLVSGRVWVWLGEISYAFYLLHFLVLAFTRHLVGQRTFSNLATFALLAGLFVLTIALSGLLHALVEKPVMKHFARSRKDRAATSAGAELPPEPDLPDDRQEDRRQAVHAS